MDQFDRWSDPEERHLNNQGALITGLTDHEPDIILGQFNKAFDDGYLTIGARETMARKVGDLFYRRHDNVMLNAAMITLERDAYLKIKHGGQVRFLNGTRSQYFETIVE